MNCKKALLLFLIVAVLSCREEQAVTEQGQKEVTRKQINAGEVLKLTHEVVPLPHPLNSTRDMLCYEGILYISEITGSDSLVKVIDPTVPVVKGHLLKAGDGPFEVSFADNLSVHDGDFSFFDPYEYEVYVQPTEEKQSISWPDEKARRIQMKDVFADNVVVLKDQILATYYFGEKLARFAVIDVRTGDLLHFSGDLPWHPRRAEIDDRILNSIYAVKPAVRPDGARFALAYDYQDLVQIYDASGQVVWEMMGPDFFYPEFDIQMREGGGFNSAPLFGKTRKSCLAIRSTMEEIWVLYSGELLYTAEGERVDKSRRSSTLFVFDWEGGFLRLVELDIPIYNFCLDADKRLIYAVSDVHDIQLLKFAWR